MAKKKKKIKSLLILLFVIAFVILANICDKGILPGFLQKPIDSANSATGGLIYAKSANSGGLSVHIIDVGQGDSIFISCEGKNMLIDGGVPDKTSTVENYLKNQNAAYLDYVVGTHPHEDHIGGLVDVVKNFDTDKIILSDAETNTQIYENLLNTIASKNKKITQAVPGSSYSLGGAKFTILAPLRTYEDLNDSSVVIRLIYKKRSFLFTGDASKESEADMLHKGENLSADVLKVGHHGSSTASTPAFLKAVNPKYAVISVGTGNNYGLPNSSVINRLKDMGIVTMRTDINGTIVFYSDGDKITYYEEKNGGNVNESS